MFWTGLIIGFFIGAAIGIALMCIVSMGKEKE